MVGLLGLLTSIAIMILLYLCPSPFDIEEFMENETNGLIVVCLLLPAVLLLVAGFGIFVWGC